MMQGSGRPPAGYADAGRGAAGHAGSKPARLAAWLQTDAGMLSLLGMLTLIYFRSVFFAESGSILSSSQFNLSDIRYQFYYWRRFGFEALARGELPLWNPYLYSGTPFIAGMQSAIFYPLNLIYLVLPVASALNLSIIVHLYLAGAFTYLLARTYGLNPVAGAFAGFTYMFSAPYALHIYPGHLSNLNTMPWTPLLFVWVELSLRHRPLRYGLLGGCTLALQVFAGHPQYVFYGSLGLLARYLAHLIRHGRSPQRGIRLRRALLSLGLVFGLGALLTAVQLLPAFEFVGQSMRREATLGFVGSFSLPLENLLLFFTPTAFGNNLDELYWGRYFIWEMCGYVGILPLLLAAMAMPSERSPHFRFALLMVGLSMLLAFGRNTPLFYVMYNLVPGFKLFRGASKFLFLAALFLALAGGFGVRVLLDRVATISARTWRASYMMLGALLVVVVLTLGILQVRYGRHPDAWRRLLTEVISRGERAPLHLYQRQADFYAKAYGEMQGSGWRFVALLAGCLALLAVQGRLRRRRLLAPMVGLFLLVDLWSFSSPYLRFYSERQSLWEPEIVSFFAADREPFRITYIHNPHTIDVNAGMAHGVSNVGGYDALVLRRYHRLINVSEGIDADAVRLKLRITLITGLMNMLNLKYVMLDGREDSPQGLQEVLRTSRHVVLKNPHYLPRVWKVSKGTWMKKDQDILAAVTGSGFDPRRFVILEEQPEQPSGPKPPGVPDEPPRIVDYRLNSVRIETAQAKYGLVVLSDTWYPGWKVYVNGDEAKLYRANYTMRAVLAPPGRSTVEFRYEPWTFRFGAAISLASLVVLLALLGWESRRRRRHHVARRSGKLHDGLSLP